MAPAPLCADPANAMELAAILSAPHYLGVAAPLSSRNNALPGMST